MSHLPLTIVADENIPVLNECFADMGTIKTLSGRNLKQQDLRACDVLLVRSVTQVNAGLLKDTNIQFVGSATIGTDHIDQDYLKANGVAFAYAPSSNAQSVVEYVLTAIAYWCQLRNKNPHQLIIGIIGRGQIGGRLAHFFEQLNIQVKCCDPPRQRAGDAGFWYPLDRLVDCDVISCHVPYTESGADATHHLVDADVLDQLKHGSLLINTSRGAVVDNKALSQALKRGQYDAILDVWENEPDIDLDLMDQLLIATPHIAGYADEAKIRGTFMLYKAVCQHFSIPVDLKFSQLLPTSNDRVQFQTVEQWIEEIVQYYDILQDDQAMRLTMKLSSQAFDKMRKSYREHQEFLADL